jgi:hypothetical protein
MSAIRRGLAVLSAAAMLAGLPGQGQGTAAARPAPEVPTAGDRFVTRDGDSGRLTAWSRPGGRGVGYRTASTGDRHPSYALDRQQESHLLTVHALGRTGAPLPAGAVKVVGLNSGSTAEAVPVTGGVGTVRVPEDDYLIELVGSSADETETWMVTMVNLRVDADTAATLDLRTAEPLTTSVPDPAVSQAMAHYGYSYRRGEQVTLSDIYSFEGGRLFVGVSGQPGPEDAMLSISSSQWAVRGPDRTFDGSPVTYRIAKVRENLIDGYHRSVRPAELARIDSYRHGPADRWIHAGMVVALGGLNGYGMSFAARPGRVTHYVDAAVPWDQNAAEVFRDPETGRWRDVHEQLQQAVSYRAGRTTAERWNAAPYVPAINFLFRQGDTLFGQLGTHGDQDGRFGTSTLDTARTRIYRDGQLIHDTPSIDYLSLDKLPAGPARYRIELTGTRPSRSDLATRTDVSWSFDSAATEEFTTLPLRTVRFRPSVDGLNRLARRPVLSIPVSLGTQPGAKPVPVRRLTVQVSGDDGRTWRPAAVLPAGNGYRAVLVTPARANSLSFRSVLTDAAGATTTQTLVAAVLLQ